MQLALGKTPARPWQAPGSKFRLTSYLPGTALPTTVPPTFGHSSLVGAQDWGVLGNDKYGCCVWSGGDHETMLWNLEAGVTVSFSDSCALGDYGACTGFNSADPATDNGTDVQDAAKYRRTTGLVDAAGRRHKIAAYLALEPGSLDHLYLANYLFSAVGVGLSLPTSAMDQFRAGQPWTVVAGSPPEGGHYVPWVGRVTTGLPVVTWGTETVMTLPFFTTYCDEAVAYVTEEDLVNQRSPEGFDYATLIADLEELSA